MTFFPERSFGRDIGRSWGTSSLYPRLSAQYCTRHNARTTLYNFHFACTEIETLWDQMTYPRSHGRQMAQPGFKPTYDSKVLAKEPWMTTQTVSWGGKRFWGTHQRQAALCAWCRITQKAGAQRALGKQPGSLHGPGYWKTISFWYFRRNHWDNLMKQIKTLLGFSTFILFSVVFCLNFLWGGSTMTFMPQDIRIYPPWSLRTSLDLPQCVLGHTIGVWGWRWGGPPHPASLGAPEAAFGCFPGQWPGLPWPMASHGPALQTRHSLSRHVPSHRLESEPAQACCNESAFHWGKTWWLANKSLFPAWPWSWAGFWEGFFFPFGILLPRACSWGVLGSMGAGILMLGVGQVALIRQDEGVPPLHREHGGHKYCICISYTGELRMATREGVYAKASTLHPLHAMVAQQPQGPRAWCILGPLPTRMLSWRCCCLGPLES